MNAPKTWIFDCDGVLLDSNRVKTQAFYELGLRYGEGVARALADYHKQNGGVSRFLKARYLLETILSGTPSDEDVLAEAERYGGIVRQQLASCEVLPGARALLGRIPSSAYRCVVSGGLESEVAWVLRQKGLAAHVDSIRGSPKPKEQHFEDLQRSGHLGHAVYFGDSRYDHEVAARFGVCFVFVSGATEFDGFDDYFRRYPDVRVVSSLEEVA